MKVHFLFLILAALAAMVMAKDPPPPCVATLIWSGNKVGELGNPKKTNSSSVNCYGTAICAVFVCTMKTAINGQVN